MRSRLRPSGCRWPTCEGQAGGAGRLRRDQPKSEGFPPSRKCSFSVIARCIDPHHTRQALRNEKRLPPARSLEPKPHPAVTPLRPWLGRALTDAFDFAAVHHRYSHARASSDPRASHGTAR
jgi:hypothetical protein